MLPGWIDRLHRLAGLAPSNPMAHYYYAVALSKQTPASMDNSVVESELKKAIDLDPKLGKAYLQLGILFAEKKETSAAIAAFKKAIENLVFPDEAHYRLAQIYRQSGQTEEARNELALYRETHKKGPGKRKNSVTKFSNLSILCASKSQMLLEFEAAVDRGCWSNVHRKSRFAIDFLTLQMVLRFRFYRGAETKSITERQNRATVRTR